MRMKILLGVVTLAVFIGGTMLRGHDWNSPQTGPSQAYAPQSAAQATYASPQSTENYTEPYSSQAAAPAQAGSYSEPVPSAQNAAPDQSVAPVQTSAPAQAMAPAQTMASAPEPAPRPVPRHRSLRRQAMIVGGSAAAGTAIGAVAGGGKGAAVGAVSGGVAGLVYDLLTRNR